ncbi:MAG: response regulator [Cyclobacteriaceae bacterium]|jgi:CheY-like chemotaxis protein|nr:response regulator [Cyclobacteriaceae bacterium]
MKILVCEDDPVVLKTMEVALRLEGTEVQLVSNGEKALACLAANRYDLIFSDIHMPYATGADVMEYVRQHNISTPVVIVSSDDEEEVVALARKMGVHAFLSKPVDVEKVRKIVRDLKK